MSGICHVNNYFYIKKSGSIKWDTIPKINWKEKKNLLLGKRKMELCFNCLPFTTKLQREQTCYHPIHLIYFKSGKLYWVWSLVIVELNWKQEIIIKIPKYLEIIPLNIYKLNNTFLINLRVKENIKREKIKYF